MDTSVTATALNRSRCNSEFVNNMYNCVKYINGIWRGDQVIQTVGPKEVFKCTECHFNLSFYHFYNLSFFTHVWLVILEYWMFPPSDQTFYGYFSLHPSLIPAQSFQIRNETSDCWLQRKRLRLRRGHSWSWVRGCCKSTLLLLLLLLPLLPFLPSPITFTQYLATRCLRKDPRRELKLYVMTQNTVSE